MNIFTRVLNDSKGVILCAGFALLSIAAAQAQTSTWTGAVSTSYTAPNNWSPAAVPSAVDNVIIPSGPANQPTLNAFGRALNLTIQPGATLTLGMLGELNLGGDLLDNGRFGGPGKLITVGSASQNIGGTGTGILGSGPININDFVIGASGAVLNHSMDLARVLDLAGTLTTSPVSTTNTLTLLSTPSETAFVINRGGAVVNGPVTVQRAIDGFLNPGLGYRHYSSPVANSTVGDLTAPGFTPEVSAGTTYNTSNNPRATVPFPTVYEYDQTRVANTAINYNPVIDRGFKVPNPALGLNAPLEVTRGYAVNISSTPVVDFVGALNNGTYTRTLARNADVPGNTAENAASGWHLLGNPYPSPLDFSVIAPPPGVLQTDLVGIDAVIYVVQSTSQYGGSYRAYMSSTNTVNPAIPLGQAFFMHVTAPGTSGTITFRNSQRLTTSDNTTFQRPTPITHPQIELSLHSSAIPVLEDVAILYFENGSTAGVDPRYDAIKLPNSTGLNMSSVSPSGEALSIDGRPMPTGQVTFPLQVFVPTDGNYTLRTDQLRNMAGYYTYLHDMQTGAMVDVAQTPNYSFSMIATNMAPRFEVLVSSRPLATASAAITQQVSLYPSPARDVAFVELPATLGGQAVQATLVDALGRTVQSIALPAQGTAVHKLSLSGLTAGVYALRLNTSAGMVVKRLVVE